MTAVDRVTRILASSPERPELLTQTGAAAKDRNLNDEDPFE